MGAYRVEIRVPSVAIGAHKGYHAETVKFEQVADSHEEAAQRAATVFNIAKGGAACILSTEFIDK
jgi:hypothetical protein